ncbi:MAG: flagellar hook-associated protein FlgK [Candidatus Kapaibacterium sp.]
MLSSLEISSRALKAQQLGLEITSNNIANVNTPGYTRQAPILSQTDPRNVMKVSIGTGTVISSLKNFRDENLDRELRNALSRQSGFAYDSKIFQQIQTAIQEPSDYGLDASFDKFFQSVEQLSNKPDDVSLRSNLLAKARALTGTFTTLGRNLQDVRQQVYGQLESNVSTTNRLLAGIADVNAAISTTSTGSESTSNVLVDKQSTLIEELSKLGNVTVQRTPTGAVTVSLNGLIVVNNGDRMNMSLSRAMDPLTGEVSAQINILDPGKNVVGSFKPAVGEMASQMRLFNETLDDRELSSAFSLPRNLNDLARGFADAVNAVSARGYGLDDPAGTPPGRPFFVSSDAGDITAISIAVNPELYDDVRRIPAAATARTPGENSIIRAIGQLVNDTSVMDGMTGREYYGATLTEFSNIGAESASGQAVSDAAVQQIGTQRENITGVNMDEEALNMIKYQRAFEAAARMVNATSDMMKSIINLGN